MTIPAPEDHPDEDQKLDPEARRDDAGYGMDVPAEKIDDDDPTGAAPQP